MNIQILQIKETMVKGRALSDPPPLFAFPSSSSDGFNSPLVHLALLMSLKTKLQNMTCQT